MKKLGLALGGGGARAMFHLGLMDVLTENKIPIGQIVGTSMGAIVGAAAACGMTSAEVLDCLKKTVPEKPFSIWKLNLSYTSLINPTDFENFLQRLFGKRLIEDCVIPFSCVAVDLELGKEVEISQGPIFNALRSSSSLPLVLPPVFYRDTLMVDGGILNNVPADHLKDELSQVKMAVNLISFKNRSELSAITFNQFIAPQKKGLLPGIRGIKRMMNSMKLMGETVLRSMEIASDVFTESVLEKSHIDLLIKYELEHGLMDFDRSAETAAKGREVMLGRMEELKRLLAD